MFIKNLNLRCSFNKFISVLLKVHLNVRKKGIFRNWFNKTRLFAENIDHRISIREVSESIRTQRTTFFLRHEIEIQSSLNMSESFDNIGPLVKVLVLIRSGGNSNKSVKIRRMISEFHGDFLKIPTTANYPRYLPKLTGFSHLYQ